MTLYGGSGEHADDERPPQQRPTSPPGPGAAAAGRVPPPAGEAARPVLGALPPGATGSPAAGQPPTGTVFGQAARPATAAGRPPATAAPEGTGERGTASTTRLPGGAEQNATATGAEPALSRQAGATLLMGGTGRAQAAAQATADAAGVAAGQQPGRARAIEQGGTVYGGGNMPHGHFDGRGGRSRVRPLTALRIGAHLASDAALDEIRVAVPGAGLLLGCDRDRRPVQIRLFRPEPTRATLVGGLWACRYAVSRALVLGARVVIFTGQPELWEGFGQRVTGRADRVAVLPDERPVVVSASPRMPALIIYDVGLLGASNRPALGPWQTQLTVLRQLTAYGFPAIQESNLVMMQRLGAEEAFSAGSVLRLTADASRLLQALRDDMLALVGGGADRYVWVNPTGAEQHQLGAPHR